MEEAEATQFKQILPAILILQALLYESETQFIKIKSYFHKFRHRHTHRERNKQSLRSAEQTHKKMKKPRRR